MKPAVLEAIVVEGRYDKNAVSQAVDAVVIETSGFGIFSDKEKIELLRKIALKRGLIIFTDSDGAGFLIRGHLNGMLPADRLKHAYTPDIFGKERRKRTPSKEGKLGVEGVGVQVILESLRRAGATFLDETASPRRVQITKLDLYEMGLSGSEGSAKRRECLIKRLELPERISTNALLDVLNALYSLDELREIFN